MQLLLPKLFVKVLPGVSVHVFSPLSFICAAFITIKQFKTTLPILIYVNLHLGCCANVSMVNDPNYT